MFRKCGVFGDDNYSVRVARAIRAGAGERCDSLPQAVMVVTMRYLLALLLLATPLGAQHQKERPDTRVLVIENRNWSDIVIYAMRSTMRQRIGEVTAVSEKTFHLPPRFFGDAGELRLYIRAIGGQSRGPDFHTTETLRIHRGDRAVLTVGLALDRSFFAVYSP